MNYFFISIVIALIILFIILVRFIYLKLFRVSVNSKLDRERAEAEVLGKIDLDYYYRDKKKK